MVNEQEGTNINFTKIEPQQKGNKEIHNLVFRALNE